jgi:hypothetical protein
MVGQDGTIIGKGSQGMSKLLDALRLGALMWMGVWSGSMR